MFNDRSLSKKMFRETHFFISKQSNVFLKYLPLFLTNQSHVNFFAVRFPKKSSITQASNRRTNNDTSNNQRQPVINEHLDRPKNSADCGPQQAAMEDARAATGTTTEEEEGGGGGPKTKETISIVTL
jgi:hypothetical protein